MVKKMNTKIMKLEREKKDNELLFAQLPSKNFYGENKDFSSELERFERRGFLSAASLNGSVDMLKLSLKKIWEDFKERAREKASSNESAKTPLKNKLTSLKSEKEKLSAELSEIKEQKIPNLEKENSELEKEINTISGRFGKFPYKNILAFNNVEFYTIVFFQIALTVFLVLFYMNSFYSAFLKNVGLEVQQASFSNQITLVFNSIFDVNTFDLLSKSALQFILILAAPSTVLVAGYLFHIKREEGKILEAAGLLLFVFLLDATLAYVIVQKIYEAKYLMGMEEKPWEFSHIFKMPEFWLVLFAGFVMYFIWGMLFNVVKTKWYQRKPEKYAIAELYKKIQKNDEKLSRLKEEASHIKSLIIQKEKEIRDLEFEIENYIFYNLTHLKSLIYSFANGWARFISGAFEDSEPMLSQVRNTTEEFLKVVEEKQK